MSRLMNFVLLLSALFGHVLHAAQPVVSQSVFLPKAFLQARRSNTTLTLEQWRRQQREDRARRAKRKREAMMKKLVEAGLSLEVVQQLPSSFLSSIPLGASLSLEFVRDYLRIWRDRLRDSRGTSRKRKASERSVQPSTTSDNGVGVDDATICFDEAVYHRLLSESMDNENLGAGDALLAGQPCASDGIDAAFFQEPQALIEGDDSVINQFADDFFVDQNTWDPFHDSRLVSASPADQNLSYQEAQAEVGYSTDTDEECAAPFEAKVKALRRKEPMQKTPRGTDKLREHQREMARQCRERRRNEAAALVIRLGI